MKIATFNVNSVRARLPVVLDWLRYQDPDVLALQETKVQDDGFPVKDFNELGYQVAMHGQKSYNGVAIISKEKATDVQFGLGDEQLDEECRVIRATFEGVTVINTYVPNGNEVGGDKWEFKMRWLDRFAQFSKEQVKSSESAIWLGDINVAPTSLDVYEAEKKLGDVGHHPDEFSRLEKIVDQGWTDCFRKHTPEGEHYTFWDFRIPNAFDRDLGWRIDHIYANGALVDKCKRCWVDTDPRVMERPSDHTPLLAEFAF